MHQILLAIFIIMSGQILSAQNAQLMVISNSGGTQNLNNINWSWTIGESIIETSNNTGVQLTQGFNQSNLSLTNITETENRLPAPKIYPNPSSNFIQIENPQKYNLFWCMYDLNGILLKEGKLYNESKQTIDVMHFPAGTYIIKLMSGQGNTSTFKLAIIH